MNVSAILLPHAACAFVYVALAGLILLQVRRSRTGAMLAGASLATAAWGMAAAFGQPLGGVAGGLDLLRGLAWYGFVLHLYRRALPRDAAGRIVGTGLGQVFTTMGLVALLAITAAVLLGQGGLVAGGLVAGGLGGGVSLLSAGILLRLTLAVCQLLLLENLYRAAVEHRWHVGLACIALGGVAAYDVVLCADAVLFHGASPALVIGRAMAMILVAPLLALAAARNRDWRIDIHVSRAAAFHSATLVGSGVFLLALAAAGEVVRVVGAPYGEGWSGVAEISLVFAGVITLAVLLTSGSARSALRGVLVDHFFTHRFDYRREWWHCIDILSGAHVPTAAGVPAGGVPAGGVPAGGVPAAMPSVPLSGRVVRALADAVDSPSGVLLTREPGQAGLAWAGSWNVAASPSLPEGHALLAALEAGAAPVVLTPAHAAPMPSAWLAVPLRHAEAGREVLAGCILLSRPRAPFRLDAEVFDLLRVLAREVATYLAEQRATRVLMETRDLRAYGERFAFVAHDIKNVSSQLSLLLSNAEIHLANPEFQRDMLATVQASVNRIGGLIRKLEAPAGALAPAAPSAGTDPWALLEAAVARLRPLGAAIHLTAAARPVDASLVKADPTEASLVAIPEAALEAALAHLLDNAVAAAGPAGLVRLTLGVEGGRAVIDIEDDGPGMTPEFVRDSLFRPFATSKPEGSGIGAYQARELARAAGGDVVVITAPGQGTTMRLSLPLVQDAAPFAVAA